MDHALHIADRFVIHVFSGGGVAILTLTAWWWAERRFHFWPRPRGWLAIAVPLFLVFTLISFREIWDVQEWGRVKSVFDWLSWLIGLGGSGYGIYRALPNLHRIVHEMEDG